MKAFRSVVERDGQAGARQRLKREVHLDFRLRLENRLVAILTERSGDMPARCAANAQPRLTTARRK